MGGHSSRGHNPFSITRRIPSTCCSHPGMGPCTKSPSCCVSNAPRGLGSCSACCSSSATLKRFSEVMWGRLLRRQQVGSLAAMQQTCAQRALQYLATLDSGDEEFLCAEDISRDVAEIRGDLEKATSESLQALFHDAQASHSVASRTRVEEGLQQCCEALREARATTVALEAQAQEYHVEV